MKSPEGLVPTSGLNRAQVDPSFVPCEPSITRGPGSAAWKLQIPRSRNGRPHLDHFQPDDGITCFSGEQIGEGFTATQGSRDMVTMGMAYLLSQSAVSRFCEPVSSCRSKQNDTPPWSLLGLRKNLSDRLCLKKPFPQSPV